jgi:16S rRNA (guanine527-N7)-methyltransferase
MMTGKDSAVSMDESAFVAELLALCQAEGIGLGLDQAMLCCRHVQLMLMWNQRSNLTRILQPEAILIKHLVDSLLPSRWLPRQGLAIDIGTGAGFPGVPLKILHPELRMVLVESHGKKVSFLKVLLGQLGLQRLTTLHTRWEALGEAGSPVAQASAALITMRALKLPDRGFAAFAARTLQPGGFLAHWSGPDNVIGLSPQRATGVDLSVQSGGTLVFSGSYDYHLPRHYGARRLSLWQRYQ